MDMQAYSDPKREDDPMALPDVEVFELSAHEAAQLDDELLYEYMKRHEYRLAAMNGRVRDAMLDAIVAEEGVTGGWFWWTCLPGCLPDGPAIGPFATQAEALADAREGVE
jgi:hypothetical protein